MARDPEPLSDEELAEFKERLEAQHQDIREALAEDLGGDPEDYDSTHHPVADGGGE